MSAREKEIIILLCRLEKKLERVRQDNRLAHYNKEKVHKKQIEFHKSQKRNRWIFGGNRSGKTECGAAETVYIARGIHPYRENRKNAEGWVVSLTDAVGRDVAQRKILGYLNPEWIAGVKMKSGSASDPENGVVDYLLVKNVFGGVSRIGFKSCESGREKFQGASLDFVWFDEEPPRDIYEECKMRVFDRKGDIFGTMTPLKGMTFVYDKIYMNESGDENIQTFSMEWADNPYLDRDEIERVSAELTQEELLVRRYGKFTAAKGLVYPEFDENTHVIEPFDVPPEWQSNISIDPGLNNPLSAHWYAVDGDDNVYVTAEHYEAGKDIDYHADAIKRVCKALNWRSDGFGGYSALIDSAAGQRTLASSKSVAELFSERGINVNTKVNKDLFTGISRVKSYLSGKNGKPKIFIFNTCKNLIREIKGYFWGDGDVPKKKDDHALDELRYFICSRPKTYCEKEKKSLIERDKSNLINQLRKRV